MNFFGTTGFVYTGNVHLKNELIRMKTRTGFSETANETEKKSSSLSRPRKAQNRKNNVDFRSVWYDDEDVAKPSASGYKLRKSSSLDSLLRPQAKQSRGRIPLTKAMISKPQFPRKFEDWSDILRQAKREFAEEIAEECSFGNEDCDNELQSLPNETEQIGQIIESGATKGLSISIVEEVETTEENNNDNTLEESAGIDDSVIAVAQTDCDHDDIEAAAPEGSVNKKENACDAISISDSGEEIILRNKKFETPLKADIPLPNLPFEGSDAPPRPNSSVFGGSEDIFPIDNVDESDILKVQTLDRYKRRNVLKTQLSYSSADKKIADILLGNIEELSPNLDDDFKKNQVTLDVISSATSVGLTVTNSKITFTERVQTKRKFIRKEDISSPFSLRRLGPDGGASHELREESSNLSSMKFLSKSTDEVLRNLQSTKDEPIPRGVGPFPRTDDSYFTQADVQIRLNNNAGNRSRQSKTMDFDYPRKSPSKTQDFDVKGLTKIHLPHERSPTKLKKNEYIKYQNNTIYLANDTRRMHEPIKPAVFLKSAKVLNKREIELRDANNFPYLLVFDSPKDLKQFTDNEKSSSLFDNEKSTITKTLLRLLGKRSSREVLEKKGIYQNEPIFGNTLRNVYEAEHGVPQFIVKTMELIGRQENIVSLGLYRTCGNLATIQKIRLEVDKGNLDILENYCKDPDVLTGCLKLFFRELKEPLMSCQTCENLLRVTRTDKNYTKKDKEMVRTILSRLPEANSETLLALIRHLVEVVKYKDLNKMDSYNLATCWGPTVIFATESSDGAKDIVTQSAEATRLFDSLLTYYSEYPEEMELRKKGHHRHDSDGNRTMIMHGEDSKDSIQSSDSGKKSSSNSSLDGIDEAVKKCIELIENAHVDGLHKKSGSTERVNKILKKMTKRKFAEMDKYKNDVYELTEALKKYLRQVHEPLVTKEVVEQVNKICDNHQCLEHSTRLKVISLLRDLPKKDTLIFLVKHLIKVIGKESIFDHDSKSHAIAMWSKVLNDPERIGEAGDRFQTFLNILLDVFDESKSDIQKMKVMPDAFLDALKDRISKYDNVPDEQDFHKEATIFEEKTDEYENTKL